jgi:hypothetical protein
LEVHAQESGASKRREILEAARHEIAHFYAEVLDGGAGHDEFSKISTRLPSAIAKSALALSGPSG